MVEIESLEEFMRNTDYLNRIIKDINNGVQIDSNIYYELVLGRIKYKKMLKKLKDRPDIKAECESLMASLDIILDGFTKEQLDEILERDTNDIQKYDKLKYYKKKTVFNGNTKKAVVHESDNYIKNYLVSGGLLRIFIVHAMMIVPLTVYIENDFWRLLELIIMMCAMFMVLSLGIDMIYISVPLMREFGPMRKLASDKAKWIGMNQESNIRVLYKPINNINRIERNLEMLNYIYELNKGNKELKKIKSLVDRYSYDRKMIHKLSAYIEYKLDELYKKGDIIIKSEDVVSAK